MKKLLAKVSFALFALCSYDVQAKTDTVWVQDNMFVPSSLTICLGDTIHFVYAPSASSMHNVHITSPIDSTSDDLTTSGDVFEFTPSDTGTYVYECDYHTGMMGVFTVITAPSVNLGSDIYACGGTVILDAGSPGSTYVWSTGETTQTINVSSSGNFWVVAYNGCGNSNGSVNVIMYPAGPIVNFGPDVTHCGSLVLDAGNPGMTYQWSVGSTAKAQTLTVNSSGTYWVVVTDTNGCSGSDTINVLISGYNPVVEGFEMPAFPPPGWSISNPDNSLTWVRTNLAAKTGSFSVMVNNHGYAAAGQKDELRSPLLCNLANSPLLTFEVAYRLYTNPNSTPNFSDTLRIQVSTDSGATWTTVYDKSGTTLATANPSYSTNQFVPTLTQWRKETIALPTAAKAFIKFVNITGYENALYIDDINISSGVSVNDIELDNFVTVFPNPTLGNVSVSISAYNLGNVSMKLYNMIGGVISETSENVSSPSKFSFDISSHSNGIYFMEVQSENQRILKKIILNK